MASFTAGMLIKPPKDSKAQTFATCVSSRYSVFPFEIITLYHFVCSISKPNTKVVEQLTINAD